MGKDQLQFTVPAKSKYADAQSAPQSVEQSIPSAKSKYADIIALPHHKAVNRKHMSMLERAAQFSPYAALVGFDGVIAETGRLTDRKIELSDAEKAVLDRKLAVLEEILKNNCGANRPQYTDFPQCTDLPLITVRYFVPDDLKAGGSYQQYTGRLKKIDRVQRVMIFVDEGREKQNGDRHDSEGTSRRTKAIPIDNALEISGEMLDSIYER